MRGSKASELAGEASARPETLPADVIVHRRLVVSGRSGKRLVRRLAASPKPTKELKALLDRHGN